MDKPDMFRATRKTYFPIKAWQKSRTIVQEARCHLAQKQGRLKLGLVLTEEKGGGGCSLYLEGYGHLL